MQVAFVQNAFHLNSKALPSPPQRQAGHGRPRAPSTASVLASAAAVAASVPGSRRRTATARAAEEEGYGREDLGPGGTDPSGRYSWERCGLTILVTAPVDEEVTKKDISASFSLRQVSISVKGEALIDGVPGCELDSEECFWEIE
ncbi:unnamed protein product, partial [Effrenium voratum]